RRAGRGDGAPGTGRRRVRGGVRAARRRPPAGRSRRLAAPPPGRRPRGGGRRGRRAGPPLRRGAALARVAQLRCLSRLRGARRALQAPRDGAAGVTEATRRSHPDYWLIGAVAALLIIGLDMVYSASFVLAHNSPEYHDDTYFVARQAIWIALGIAA